MAGAGESYARRIGSLAASASPRAGNPLTAKPGAPSAGPGSPAPAPIALASGNRPDLEVSVLVLGETGVGKSAFVRALQPRPLLAAGLAASLQSGAVSGGGGGDGGAAADAAFGPSRSHVTLDALGTALRLALWEVPGAPRYLASVPRYATLAAALVLVYDPNRRPSFLRLRQWLDAARARTSTAAGGIRRSEAGEEEAGVARPWPAPLLVVATKSDSPRAAAGAVERAEGEAFAQAAGGAFFEISSASGACAADAGARGWRCGHSRACVGWLRARCVCARCVRALRARVRECVCACACQFASVCAAREFH
jgi:GTPase SAR1 family protein